MSFQFSFLQDIKKMYQNEIKDISQENALDSIIYGTCCHRIKKGSPSKGMLSISDKIYDHLCFSNQVKNKIKSFHLKNIENISFDQKNENLKYFKKIEEKKFLNINYNKKTYTFCFNDKTKFYLFIKGLISLFDTEKSFDTKDNTKEVANYMEDNINRLFSRQSTDFNNMLDEIEFNNFADEIGIDPKEFLLYIDQNRDGYVSKEEVINYYKLFISGTEFLDIFKKYASIKNKHSNSVYNNDYNGEYTMNPQELKNFFNEVQKEPINDLEAYQLVINFKSYISSETKRKMLKKFQNIYLYNNYQMNEAHVNIAMEKLNKEINKEKNKLLTNKNIFNKKKTIFVTDKNIEIKLELNLKEFSTMLNSFLLTVYDKKYQIKDLNTSHSLVDYYINSSHNTYLKGHQLVGESDSKMYAFAVLNGYRLVELDCYNGQDDDDIIITHGYTYVTKIKLDDVLKELKENAFKNSPYPVILSVENHLDKKHQEILTKKFLKYLVDIYIFPYDSPPKSIPTLEELKYKFIIKCGGKRLWEWVSIPLNELYKIDESDNLKEKNLNNNIKKYILEDNYEDGFIDSDEEANFENIEEFNTHRHRIVVNEEQNIKTIYSIKNNINRNKTLDVKLKNKNQIKNINLENDSNEDFKKLSTEMKKETENNNNKIENDVKNVIKIPDEGDLNNNYCNKEEINEGYIEVNNGEIIENENEIEIESPTSPNLNKIKGENNNHEEIIDINNLNKVEDDENEENEENECIKCLENVRGLLGQKFKYEKIDSFKYKHWEFVTLKSTLFLQLYQNLEKRKKVIKLSFHCMMKAYPQKFNSSNYDIIKCWCCGCQAAAVNIQATEDDYTLFNQIFFTQNNNYGYVLKPKKFLFNTFQFEEYKIPKYFLNIQIITMFNFTKLLEVANIPQTKNCKMNMKIYTLGPYTENDYINSKKYKNEYLFELYGGLLTPCIAHNQTIKMPVYEENLGGIMIKFFYNNELIGRGCIPYCLMKMGYRKIPIYSNDCLVRESVFVVGYFEKVF